LPYPRIRINPEGKEREPMRKYLAMFYMLVLAATIGLSACAEQKKPEPPPPPPPAAAPAAPADNAVKPAAPMAPAEAPKK